LFHIKIKERMQNKYLSALRTKYASFGLSKEALDRVALQRVKTIANEDEIDADIANSDTLMLIMKEMQGSADSQRNRVAQIQKELEDLKKTQTPNQTNPQPLEDNPLAAELKAIKEMFAGMKAEMDAEKKKAQKDAVIARAHDVMKQNGCTNDFIRNMTLKGVEIGENDTADSIAEKYKSIYDQNCKEAYGDGYVPPKGNSGGSGENDKDAETAILKRAGLL
jgi:hypothetical protein